MDVGGLDRILRPLGADDPRTVAGYRLAGRLGAGGMGKVYLSYTRGGRPVAIKVIRPEFADDPEFRRRFAQEVHAAQRVQGLYTAPVVDSDTEGDQPWLATAYVTGPALADVVTEERPLPLDSVVLLVAGVAEALTAIHGAGVVHRDLKPSNVLLAADGPRVIDFGIARAADATALTGSGLLIGTPAFMSPEQAAGRKLTPATDVFALGQVAVFAATGRPAHGEGPSHAVVYRIVHEEPDLTGVPDVLRPVVDLCLAKEPAERGALAEIIRACETAGGQTQLRIGEGWLPPPVAAAITERTRGVAAPPPPAATPPPVAAPPPAQPPVPAAPPAPAAPPTPAAPPPSVPPAPAASPAQSAVPAPTAAPADATSPTPADTPPTPAETPAPAETPPPAAPSVPGTPPAPASPSAPSPPAAQPPPAAYAETTQTAAAGPVHPPTQAARPAEPPTRQRPAPGARRPDPPHPRPGVQEQPAPRPRKRRVGLFAGLLAGALLLGAGGGAYLVNTLQDDDGGGSSSDTGRQDRSSGTKPRTDDDGDGDGTQQDTGGTQPDEDPTASAPPADPEPAVYDGIELPASYHLNLNDEPLRPESDGDGDIEHDSGPYLQTDQGRFVLLQPTEEPTLDTCREVTRYTESIYLGDVEEGAHICLETQAGHIALITYQGVSPESDPSSYVVLDVTVWRNDTAQP